MKLKSKKFYGCTVLMLVFLTPTVSYAAKTEPSTEIKALSRLLNSYVKPIKWSRSDRDMDGIEDKKEKQLGANNILNDTDGDGLSDGEELGDINNPLDFDNDGRLNIVDQDDDNDGIPTVLEAKTDTDGDLLPDYLDTDSDGDGLVDGMEVSRSHQDNDKDNIDDAFNADFTGGKDENGDGVDDNIVFRDSDNDGIPDVRDTDLVRSEALSRVKKSQTERDMKKTRVLQQAQREAETQANREKNRLPFDKTPYVVSGYFYCLASNKILPGAKILKVAKRSSNTVDVSGRMLRILRDGKEGDYLWKASEPGIYSISFVLPEGGEVVSGLAKGRRIVTANDRAPLIIGPGEDSQKKGHLVYSASQIWHASFDFKKGSHPVMNNNIPVEGAVCQTAAKKS